MLYVILIIYFPLSIILYPVLFDCMQYLVLQYSIRYHNVSTLTSKKHISIFIDIKFVLIYIRFAIQISCIWICISDIFYLILSHGFVFPSSRLHLWLLGIYWIIYYS